MLCCFSYALWQKHTLNAILLHTFTPSLTCIVISLCVCTCMCVCVHVHYMWSSKFQIYFSAVACLYLIFRLPKRRLRKLHPLRSNLLLISLLLPLPPTNHFPPLFKLPLPLLVSTAAMTDSLQAHLGQA